MKQPTPRKGTETHKITVIFHPPFETTHTPQGDGNLCDIVPSIRRSETTHTPQGDGNRFNSACHLQRVRNNPHPARGRKQPSLNLPSTFPGNNPHPARGRKPFRLKTGIRVTETTHTPQGDGNSAVCHTVPSSHETTHTPQGDGNTESRALNQHAASKQPTPRKGTETA